MFISLSPLTKLRSALSAALRTFDGKLLIFVIFFIPHFSQAQGSGEGSSGRQFSGVITATNNGISIIPSFSLGRPALMFDLSMGGSRFSFDPMLRFGMDGKPWAFVFWGRYKVIKDKRFTLTVGGHPAFLFQERLVTVNGKEELMLVNQRFLALEVAPMYKLTPRTSVGLYYLQGHGFNPIPPKSSNFLALNTVISDVPLVADLRLRMNPQFFFLRVDNSSGTYFTSNFTVTKPGFPIGVQALFNQKIKSTVVGEDFLWNVSLIYSFANKYTKNKS